jgi:AraC family transcriptional regulator
MHEALLGEVRIANGSIEVRRYGWLKPELLTFRRENYMLSRFLAGTCPNRSFGWKLPSTSHTMSAIQMSVVPPASPVSVAFDRGEALIVSCILQPDYFERIAGITDWRDEHTQLCLGLRSPLIGLLFNRLAHEVYFERRNSADVAEAFVAALSVEIGRGIERSSAIRPIGQLAPWQLQQIYSLIDAETRGKWLTVEQIANRCSLSERHLMRAFKASTGLTLHQYSSEVRMQRAMSTLRNENKPLKVLAAELGFSSPSAFAAAFRQNVGCTPSEFRHLMRAH